MSKLGTLRTVYTHVYTEIQENDFKSESDICREGDKYEFALDGIVLNFDAKETGGAEPLDSQILLDFSILPTEKEEVLLVNFPYSCRGTRQNPKFIPLSRDADFPRLPVNRKFYYKIRNTDTQADHAIQGVAIVIYGRPVIGNEE